MPDTYKKATEPGEIPALFVEAWMKRDADMLASLFAEDAEFVNVVGLWWHNQKDIRQAHDYGFKKIFNNSSLSLRETSVKYLSEDIAVVHARMRLKDQTPKDKIKTPSLRQNIFSFVTQKKDGYWLCVSAHNTDIVPGAETNIIDEGGELRPVNYRK
ncbi:MAG TPA: SgcJ/EcaC family oxidoreductase [Gracilimonas sp.]|uniref:SgcJ/EcaC family oxidoreductase n=1 Tax=Gracilimonas sp. TaxID=1974203 RepID=UPI002D961BBD|nr:SgcJ/EcaC family oxidoreductase [Gracilimonas sp.]